MDTKSLLPKELDIEIMRRLSVKSLFRFKRVCKNWYSLIRSPSFIARYSSSFNPRNKNKILCFGKDPISKAHVMSLLNCRTREKVIDLECPPLLEEWPSFLEEWSQFQDEETDMKEVLHRDVNILGPVNGIYCIYYRLIEREVGTLVLWNPSTREYKHILPAVRYPFPFQLLAVKWNPNEYIFNEKNPTGLNIGFGFANNTNDIKIVVISQWQHFYGPSNDGWHVKVYNLSTDSWKTIYYITDYSDVLPTAFQGLHPRCPNIYSNPEFSYGFLNGVFHWSGTWEYINDGVVAFNMVDESFQLIKGPVPSSGNYNCRSVWVLEETLTIVLSSVDFTSDHGSIEVWMMKEYGVEDSWTMIHSFGPITGLRFIGLPIDDQIFCCNDEGQLVSYDFEDHAVTQYGVHGLCEMLEFGIKVNLGVLRYAETILPLNTVAYNEVRQLL